MKPYKLAITEHSGGRSPSPADLARHRAELRQRPEAMKLAIEVSNIGYITQQLRRQVADSPLRRTIGAHMLLAQVEASLRTAAAQLNLAHQALVARGPYRERGAA